MGLDKGEDFLKAENERKKIDIKKLIIMKIDLLHLLCMKQKLFFIIQFFILVFRPCSGKIVDILRTCC